MSLPRLHRWLPLSVGLLFAGVAALGCKPDIGDACKLSTDCSITGDRLCDTSQPEGYCTIFNCDPNSCPDGSLCVEFHPNETRLRRRFCLASCEAHSDCRPGYVCAGLSLDRKAPTPDRDAVIVDTEPSRTAVCLP